MSGTPGIHLRDNEKLRLGDAEDAEVYYDGTDLIIKSDVVGSGGVTFPGGIITLSNATTNRIQLGTVGVEAPGTDSVGLKIKLHGAAGAMAVNDYALGIQSSFMWFNTGAGYRWYVGSSIKMVYNNDVLSFGADVHLEFPADNADKLRLYSGASANKWGFAIDTNALAMYMESTSHALRFSWRQAVDAANPGTGTEVFALHPYSGQMDINIQQAAYPGCIITAAASQSANLQEWRDNTPTVVASIGLGGALDVPSFDGATATQVKLTAEAYT